MLAKEVAGLACGCDVEEKVKGNKESRTVSSGCLGIQVGGQSSRAYGLNIRIFKYS